MNQVSWFEIPVNNMQKAVDFYNHVFNYNVSSNPMGELEMAWFPHSNKNYGAGGALVKHPEFYIPSKTHGVLVYFISEDIPLTLSKVVEKGGKVIQEKKMIAPDVGYMALFEDCEGNRIALHSNE